MYLLSCAWRANEVGHARPADMCNGNTTAVTKRRDSNRGSSCSSATINTKDDRDRNNSTKERLGVTEREREWETTGL